MKINDLAGEARISLLTALLEADMRRLIVAGAALIGLTMAAYAQSAEDFYRGKTVFLHRSHRTRRWLGQPMAV